MSHRASAVGYTPLASIACPLTTVKCNAAISTPHTTCAIRLAATSAASIPMPPDQSAAARSECVVPIHPGISAESGTVR